MTFAYQISVYSRPGEGDADDQGRYEYNGSFGSNVLPEEADETTREAWAAMMDCFHVVLFQVVERKTITPHNRTWLDHRKPAEIRAALAPAQVPVIETTYDANRLETKSQGQRVLGLDVKGDLGPDKQNVTLYVDGKPVATAQRRRHNEPQKPHWTVYGLNGVVIGTTVNSPTALGSQVRRIVADYINRNRS